MHRKSILFVFLSTLLALVAGPALADPGSSSFSAYINGIYTFTTAETILPFNTESYDRGENYDTGTYTYTVPSNGSYLVNIEVCSANDQGPGQNNWILLKVNNSNVRITGTVFYGTSRIQCLCLHSILELTAEDTVNIYADAEASGYFKTGSGPLYTEFSVTEVDYEAGGDGVAIDYTEHINQFANIVAIGFAIITAIGAGLFTINVWS